jgi:hypothetical protein
LLAALNTPATLAGSVDSSIAEASSETTKSYSPCYPEIGKCSFFMSSSANPASGFLRRLSGLVEVLFYFAEESQIVFETGRRGLGKDKLSLNEESLFLTESKSEGSATESMRVRRVRCCWHMPRQTP